MMQAVQQQRPLRYAYALVAVFLGSALLLATIGSWRRASHERDQERINLYHLETLTSLLEIGDTIQEIMTGFRGTENELLESDAQAETSRVRMHRLNAVVESRLGIIRELEQQFGGESCDPIIRRAIQRHIRLSERLDSGVPVRETYAEWRALQIAVLQLDRLHKLAVESEIDRITEERERVDAETLIGLLVVFFGSGWVIVRLTRRLRNSLEEQAKSQEALIESERRFERAQRIDALGTMVGGVAHDFNNLLTVVLGQAELLALGRLEDDQRRQVALELERAAEHGVALTRQLLTFSRQEPVAPCNVDLNEIIRGLGGMLRTILRSEIDTRIELAEQLPNIRADPGQLERVVVNLVSNAADAIETTGTLTIQTAMVSKPEPGLWDDGEAQPSDAASLASAGVSQGAYVRLRVSDSGCGMPAEVREHAFEPFFTTKERGRGTGLGLSVVHGVVKEIGGHIDLRSEPGVGTTLEVFFPCAKSEPLRAEASADLATVGGTERILLVEDDPQVLRVAEGTLRAAGYEVLSAPTPAAGLRVLEASAVDLLVSDVVLPGLRGPEFAKRALELRPGLPVVFLSGYSEDAILRAVRESRHPLVSKPFTTRSLLQAVRAALDGCGEAGGAEVETSSS